jgi:SWI/SNF complex component SWP73
MAPVPHNPSAVAGTKQRSATGANPAVSYVPTDTTIPEGLYEKIPNLELYKKLKTAERDIDLLISRKALDFQAIQQKSVQPSNLQEETGILRVFIYNTCENQPWQNKDPLSTQEASWTLRVEGRFLNDNSNGAINENLKFSSFLSAISIDLIPNEDYPNLQNAQSNIIEWRDDPSDNRNTPIFDGIDVKRNGVFDIKCKIALLVKSHSTKLTLLDEMAQFAGKVECTQPELIYLIWNYVLFKDLFLKSDSLTKVPVVSTDIVPNDDEDQHTIVKSDDILKKLLKVDSFKFSDLYKLIQPHFKPRQPTVVEYTVNTKQSTTLGEVVLDIPIELPLNLSKLQKELTELNKSALDHLTKSDMAIQQLNAKISLGITALQNANAREQFYQEFKNDPVGFIDQWLESQAETLKALKSDEGYDEEVVRRANYFEENEQLIKDKINLLLGTNKF